MTGLFDLLRLLPTEGVPRAYRVSYGFQFGQLPDLNRMITIALVEFEGWLLFAVPNEEQAHEYHQAKILGVV
ncbi:MAG: hypothetical protein HWE23_08315 [Rhodobacteraceae bacterium]|nr:hypothetical protein [Paracoccaceae bacterium]